MMLRVELSRKEHGGFAFSSVSRKFFKVNFIIMLWIQSRVKYVFLAAKFDHLC